MTASHTHLVLIPSYNTGPRLLETVTEALTHWNPVWVVIDGSTDGSEIAVAGTRRERDPRVRVIRARTQRRQGRGGRNRSNAGARVRIHSRADDGR